jgi:hypothetical protein
MAKITDSMKDGETAAPAFDKPKPDYEKDPNNQARKRAAKRSGNRNAGKPVDAMEDAAPEVEAVAPEAPEAAPEGGIVKEAEVELAEAKTEEASENETPAEETAETPAEETAETPAEETPAPAEEAPAEESSEAPGEYQAPEGESHGDLVNKYHEAIAYGDVAQANELYKQLQEHRYHENKHRGVADAASEAEAREHLAVAKALAAKHPELNEDGLAADKVLALAEIYRNNGEKPAAALKQAVADLYPENPVGNLEAEVPPAEPEAAAEVPSSPAEEPAAEAPEAASEETAAANEPIPGMEERNLRKRAIAEVPSASARNEPAPPPEKPTRSSAIEKMKAARGQK